jgi:hypothetical protein
MLLIQPEKGSPMSLLKPLYVTALLLLLVACSSQESPSPLTVNTDGNHYDNAFFGVGVEKPDGWYAQNPEETIALQQRGTAVLAGDKEGMRALIEASLESSVPIFGFFEVPPGTPGRMNPNVLGIAENITPFPGVREGCDYLEHVKHLLLQGNLPYRFEQECRSRTLSGRTLGLIVGTVELGEVTVTQRYYALVQKPYALAFVQTFYDDEGRENTGRIIDSLTFDQES